VQGDETEKEPATTSQVQFNLWSSNNKLMKVTPVLFLTIWLNAHDN